MSLDNPLYHFTREDVRVFGDHLTALLFRHIAYRCNLGPWRATREQISEETTLSMKQLRRLLPALRDAGWIAGERENPQVATLTWRVLRYPGEPEEAQRDLTESEGSVEKAERALSEPQKGTPVKAERALSSYKTEDRTTTHSPPPVAVAPDAVVIQGPFAGPETDLFGAPIEDRPRHDAGTVVAAWERGQRDVGEEPHPGVQARVRGHAKQAAKHCRSVEDWRRLEDAGYRAGRHGKYDIVTFLVRGEPQQSQFKSGEAAGMEALMRMAANPTNGVESMFRTKPPLTR